MLECSDNSLYIGLTSDLVHRLEEHDHGTRADAYTYPRRPVKLVYSASFSDVWEAIRWERQIKGWTRKKKLALKDGKFEVLPLLAKKDFSKKKH